jgi:hypothetical protein
MACGVYKNIGVVKPILKMHCVCALMAWCCYQEWQNYGTLGGKYADAVRAGEFGIVIQSGHLANEMYSCGHKIAGYSDFRHVLPEELML